jgi:hypothetical protein
MAIMEVRREEIIRMGIWAIEDTEARVGRLLETEAVVRLETADIRRMEEARLAVDTIEAVDLPILTNIPIMAEAAVLTDAVVQCLLRLETTFPHHRRLMVAVEALRSIIEARTE